MTRRLQILKSVVLAGIVSTAGTAWAEEITVSSWGGFFEETLKEVIYPGFTAETGIEVRSIAQPVDEAWITQIINAARANTTPADLVLMSTAALARGQSIGLWATLDGEAMPNTSNLKDGFIKSGDDGGVYAVGAMNWYTTFVTNTDFTSDAPESWAELWENDWDGKLGIISLPNSGLLEAAAVTFFGGYEIMETREGLETLIAKVAELKPEIRLWYRDEGQFQQGIETGEFSAGLYYHDVTTFSSYDGNPVLSTFPKEGGILGEAYWVVPRDSDKTESAELFINYMSRPEIQAELSRTLGVAPVARRDTMDLTDEEFAGVGSEIEPIRIQFEIHLREGDWLSDKYLEMITD